MKPNAKLFRNAMLAVTVAGFGWGISTRIHAQSSDYDMSFSVAEIMDAIVMPEADVIWGAVGFVSTEDGFKSIGPETDEDWLNLRRGAVALAESANSLIIPGRHANKPGAVANEGELSPAEIDELMASNRAAWVAYANALRSSAMKTIEAIDARDLDQILDVGGDIDTACESCHVTFWYPNQ